MTEYRAVGNRCAVDFGALKLKVSQEEALVVLAKQGVREVAVDLSNAARRCVGMSQYCRGALLSDAPYSVDCSSFVKWLYGLRGVWIPRRSIQQRFHGEIVALEDSVEGDLVFTTGCRNWYDKNPARGIGHVGFLTKERTVIHAANKKKGVAEVSLEKFIRGEDVFRGVRRYVPLGANIVTLEIPSRLEVETSDDLKWIILRLLA